MPIWLDLISDPSEWTDSFLLPEAKEVLDVLGGVVVVFAIPPATAGKDVVEKTKDVIKNVAKVVKEGLGGWEWDGVGLGVGVGEAGMDELDVWDNACADCGLEFVHVAAGGHVAAGAEEKRNEFGGGLCFLLSSGLGLSERYVLTFEQRKVASLEYSRRWNRTTGTSH